MEGYEFKLLIQFFIREERSDSTMKFKKHKQNNLITIVMSAEYILMKRHVSRMIMEITVKD